jgi:sec-independent protein translocase protein TatA
MFDSPWHWLVVAAVAFVLFFGWKQLPDMSRSLGRSLRIFKTEIKGMSQDDAARDAAAPDAQGNAAPRELEPGANPPPVPHAEVVRNRPRPAPGGGSPTSRTDSQGSTSAR